jgi:hypothetical protein
MTETMRPNPASALDAPIGTEFNTDGSSGVPVTSIVRQDATNLQICDNRMHEVAKIHA